MGGGSEGNDGRSRGPREGCGRGGGQREAQMSSSAGAQTHRPLPLAPQSHVPWEEHTLDGAPGHDWLQEGP